MINHNNFERLNFGQIIPGWATVPTYNFGTQGALALICHSDIITLDNPSGFRKWRLAHGKSLGYTDEDLLKKSGISDLTLNQVRKSKPNVERNFLFDLGLKVPSNISFTDLMSFRKEKAVLELRKEFAYFKSLDYKARKNRMHILQKKMRNFNQESSENFQTKSLFLSGLFATLGGLIGGIKGSFLGGVGSSFAVYCAARSRKKLEWMQFLNKFIFE
jgi:transcriptional regulator with XRE-family HTH domain